MSTETANQPAGLSEPPTVAVPSSDWFASLREYVSADEIAKTRQIFDGHVSHELIVIVTAIRGLAESCDEAAQFAYDDERPFKGEEYEQRASAYRQCHKALVEAWDGHDEANK